MTTKSPCSLCDDAIGEDASTVEMHFFDMEVYAKGKDDEANDPDVGEIVWGWAFEATDDDRTCEICRSYNGVRLPKHHSFWKYGKPPLRRGCRCDRMVITIFDIEDGRALQTPEHLVPKDWREDSTT